MKTAAESACLCRYLHTLAAEREVSHEELSFTTGIPVEKIKAIMEESDDPTLTEMISIGNVLGVKFTCQKSVSFAHQKIVNHMESTGTTHDHHRTRGIVKVMS